MLRFILLIALSAMLAACQQNANNAPEEKKAELLIYSGITMVRPLQQLAKEFEQKKGVKITIIQGASGFILNTLKSQQTGDIYFPGSTIFREQPQNREIFKRYVLVGYNRLAIITPKGNPKGLTADLQQLSDPELSVVLSSPDTSAVGKATAELLQRLDLQEQAFENVTYFTTDSHRIFKAIRNGDADLAINWFATTKWPETEAYMSAIPINEKLAPKRSLELILLKYAKNKKLALEFMNYASSKQGLKAFAEYGFLTDDELRTLQSNPRTIQTMESSQ